MTSPVHGNPSLDFVAHLRADSARFAEVLAAADPTARVPTCPDWDADDLLWHLAEVQWFWGTIVGERITDRARADELRPSRPGTRDDLQGFYAASSSALAEALLATPDDAPVWTWADDQTAGFVRRRQAHEALIHRVDAELTAGLPARIDTALAADGVDEVLRVMYGGAPDWGTFTPAHDQTVRVATSDTGHSWVLTLGVFQGTDPEGNEQTFADLRVSDRDDGAPVAAELRGSAADLDLDLWHRPALGPIERAGDSDVHNAFKAAVADGID